MQLRLFGVVVSVFVSLFFGHLIEPPHALAQDGDWLVPRTHAGHPDLQGVWLNNAAIPLERPAALDGRSQLTDEEVAELQARANQIFENGRSAFTTPGGAFVAALEEVETYEAWSTSKITNLNVTDNGNWSPSRRKNIVPIQSTHLENFTKNGN